MKKLRVLALALVLALLMQLCVFADDNYMNRGEVADLLLLAADDYNPTLVRSDIIKGYEDGLLHEERNVTRAEALVMLKRAFGTLPVPTGHNKRIALSVENFTDIPLWAKAELEDVFNCGIVAGTGNGKFSPDANVTRDQMKLFIERVYSLYGSNLKDDFYATVNKDILEKFEILPGNAVAGTLMDMQINTVTAIDSVIIKLSQKENEKDTKEQKIADFYNCIVDVSTRNEAGVKPIKPYLESIDAVRNISALTHVHDLLSEELCMDVFVKFGLTVDIENSSKYMLAFETMRPLMTKEVYTDEHKSEVYVNYIEKILVLSGETPEVAKTNAKAYFEFEKKLAQKMLDTEESQDLEKIYNINSYNKINMMFPDFDLEKNLANRSLVKGDKIVIEDMALTQEFASLYNQANLPVLKTAMKVRVIENVSDMLSIDFIQARRELNLVLLGTAGTTDVRQIAVSVIETVMPEYLSQIYGEMYFDEEVKENILSMTQDIISTFKKRIDNLSWMKEETKLKAKEKLDAIKVKVGYPKLESTYLDDVEILSPKEGGTYFGNMLSIMKAATKSYGAMQFASVNNDAWMINSYDVNAAYNPTANDITIPVAILMSPIYDKGASYEENLGGIGFIIAHEITHAFDSFGAQFDEYGNVGNWWTQEDYAEFNKRCGGIVEFFDGIESIPAVRNNGSLTLNENIADLGAAACITDIAVSKSLDIKKMYTSVAKVWASTYTREYASLLAEIDTHSAGKLRINCVLANIDEFYDAFGITEKDGMYVPPEKRVLIW